MIFKYSYSPVVEDYDKDGIMTLSGILRIFENAGNGHSEAANFSLFSKEGRSKVWILTDWQIELDSRPVYGEEVRVETWTEGLRSPLCTNRDYLLYRNNEICGRGISQWILFDTALGRPVKIDSQLLENYGPEQKRIFESSRLSKIPQMEEIFSESKIALRRSDIDFNGHVHNTQYLDFAMEALPEEVFLNCNFSSIRINYKSALVSEREVYCRYSKQNESYLVNIYDSKNELKSSVELKV